MTKQIWTAAVAALLFVALAAVIAMVPVPYVAWTAGSTYDLLGTVPTADASKPAIQVTGAETFPTGGQMRMATVSVTRPDSALTLPEALFSYWLPDREVLPREVIYQPGDDPAAIEDDNSRLMGDSQNSAIVAALRAAGLKVADLPMVRWVTAAGPAGGRLKVGDLITAVDGNPVTKVAEVEWWIRRDRKVGDQVTINFKRDGASLSQILKTRGSATQPDVPEIGVGLTRGYEYSPRVTFGIDPAIGGPSAGLPFAIALYDLLTPGKLLGDRSVAATGAIDANGKVSRIGGLQEKVAAAARDGVGVLIMPRSSCEDIPADTSGVQLVPVENLGEALAALDALGKPDKAATVPHC